jgi:hypothetical protein
MPLLSRHVERSQSFTLCVQSFFPVRFSCMNENSQPGFGKISVHGDGMGAPTPELIERRAREIALIDERDPDNYTDADWDQARRELLGVENSGAPEDVPANTDVEDEHEIVPASPGHRAPRNGFEDDETLGEHLVTDGLEEATHDQMLEARHEEIEEEGGF